MLKEVNTETNSKAIRGICERLGGANKIMDFPGLVGTLKENLELKEIESMDPYMVEILFHQNSSPRSASTASKFYCCRVDYTMYPEANVHMCSMCIVLSMHCAYDSVCWVSGR